MDQADALPPPVDDAKWRRVLHRWFVEYNPLYLASAALVLVGVVMASRSLAVGAVESQLWITAIAELYAWALIGGAALLARIQLRRPATMLSLLALFYQCDPTLHTETCALLGTTGALASALWLLSFVAKLGALQWAMKLRLSRSAVGVTLLGATFVAGFPWVLRLLEPEVASAWLGVAVFVVLAAGLWTHRAVHSRLAVTGWACLVTRRSVRGTWLGFAMMLGVHVVFWLSQHPRLGGVPTVLALVLLSTRLVTRESRVWLVVASSLAWTLLSHPEVTWVAAILGAAALLLRAFRCPRWSAPADPTRAAELEDVYRREPDSATPSALPPTRLHFEVLYGAARHRLLLGAIACLYLAVWTQGWRGGPWPTHLVWLDALLVTACVCIAWRTHVRIWLPLPALTIVHAVAVSGLVPVPQSVLQWGIACIGAGFGLLAVSLAVAVAWRPCARDGAGDAVGSSADVPPPPPASAAPAPLG